MSSVVSARDSVTPPPGTAGAGATKPEFRTTAEALLDDITALTELQANSVGEDHLLGNLAWKLMELTGADAADILLTTQGRNLVLRASTIAPEYVGRLRLGRGVGITGQVCVTGKTVVIRRNFGHHPHFAKYPGYDERGFESAIVQPMTAGGEPRGVLMLRRNTEWRAGKRELKRIERLALAAWDAYNGYRAAYLAGTRINRLGALSEVTSIISRSPYLEEILQLLVNMTAQQFGYKVCTVRLLDESNQELVLRATQATMKAYQRKRAIKLGESIAGRAIVEKRSLVVPDVQLEEEYIGHDLAEEQGLRSMICVPLLIQERPVGVLTCYTADLHYFGEDEIAALETIAKQAAVSIEHAKLQVRHTLMQEMHHRVKNNLQQVVSLLRLQLRHSHYTSIEQAINDSLNRILAIAAVHDLLSREDLDHVGIRSIAESLVHHHQQSFMPPDKFIDFEVRGEDVRLNMTQATQIALVINELIQNALEHGFKESSVGAIHINVEEEDGEIGIWVSNDGDPLPIGFDHRVAAHLGLQIVSNLARALGGKFSLTDRLGWSVAELKFARQGSE